MPNLTYPVAAILMAPSTVKVWDISVSNPPGGALAWRQAGYDDSAWPTAVAQTFQHANFFDPSTMAPLYTCTGYGLGDPNAEGIRRGVYAELPRPSAFAPTATPQPPAASHPGVAYAFAWRFTYAPPSPGNWVLGLVETWTWFGHPLGGGNRLPFTTWLPNFLYPDFASAAAAGSVWFYPQTDVDQGATTFVTPGLLVGTLQWDSLFSLDFWRASRLIFFQLDGVPNGSVASWGTPVLGATDKGAMGTGVSNVASTVPVATLAPTNTAKVASNGKTTIFLTSDGLLYGCGDNSQGMLGIGSADSADHSTPIRVGAFDSIFPTRYVFDELGIAFHDVSVGGDCVLALDRGGRVWGWGPNVFGSLGRYDYPAGTPQYTPREVGVLGPNSTFIATSISAGKNFSAACALSSQYGTGNGNLMYVAGDNTYGQFGNGTTTSGATWANYATPTSDTAQWYGVVSCGEDVLWLVSRGVFIAWGCGRGEWGNLGSDVYGSLGTGVHKIQTTLHQDAQQVSVVQAEPVGPLSFLLSAVQITYFIDVWGDGTPFGGDGTNAYDGFLTIGTPPATQIWGQTAFIGQTIDGNDFSSFFPNNIFYPFQQPITGLAFSGAGATNPYSLGNSEAMFAAYGRRTATSSSNIGPSDGLLYTWGWGGAGQMGNGTTTATNIRPISGNGLTGVISATCTAGIMFSVQSSIGPVIVRRGRSFVQMIGD